MASGLGDGTEAGRRVESLGAGPLLGLVVCAVHAARAAGFQPAGRGAGDAAGLRRSQGQRGPVTGACAALWRDGAACRRNSDIFGAALGATSVSADRR